MNKIQQGRRILDDMNSGDTAKAPPLEQNSDKFKRALGSLLEPDKLNKFIDLWTDKPQEALQELGLKPKDAQGFYEHLANKGVVLQWPLWF